MILTDEEQAILDGSQGPVMAKILKTVVTFGDTFGAEHLVPLDHAVHLVTSFGMIGLDPVFDMMDEIIAAGIRTPEPFTCDPRPYDFEALPYDDDIKESVLKLYANQDRYEAQLLKLGLKDADSFSCASYLPEGGNTPKKGDVLAWAESSAAVLANSLLSAQTNCNSGAVELVWGLLHKATLSGLLPDEGRKADWLVEVKTSEKPNPQLLGSALGIKVVGDVPYLVGLDKFLGTEITDNVRDFLKDMGAASASNGAVGLYYVEKRPSPSPTSGHNRLPAPVAESDLQHRRPDRRGTEKGRPAAGSAQDGVDVGAEDHRQVQRGQGRLRPPAQPRPAPAPRLFADA